MTAPAHATSSVVALFVVGVALLGASCLMLRAFVRARAVYREAQRTRRRIAGRVTGHKSRGDEGSTLYSPVIEFTDPKTGRSATYSPPLTTSFGKLREGREVPLLWDERGREPIVDVHPFGAGFTGGVFFLVMSLCLAGLGTLAMYAAVWSH